MLPEIERRQVVKTAAWAAPVIAAAVTVPMAAASQGFWDVGITGRCSTGLLGILGQSRLDFMITAVQGTIPAGTAFTLSSSALLNVAALGASPNGLLSISLLSGSSALLTLTSPLVQGSSVGINLLGQLVTVGLVYTYTLQLNGNDHPSSPTTAAPNSASLSVLAQINLGVSSVVCL
ncbi:hypothetical protein [Sinomonas susongensis]|uniref:hypothetical protein n=1 Tax=Sinomonas susongensis TaxID=1324851 RepID=UPI0011086247|nr:hypothetical protein [Sinomonas susongensis]